MRVYCGAVCGFWKVSLLLRLQNNVKCGVDRRRQGQGRRAGREGGIGGNALWRRAGGGVVSQEPPAGRMTQCGQGEAMQGVTDKTGLGFRGQRAWDLDKVRMVFQPLFLFWQERMVQVPLTLRLYSGGENG